MPRENLATKLNQPMLATGPPGKGSNFFTFYLEQALLSRREIQHCYNFQATNIHGHATKN